MIRNTIQRDIILDTVSRMKGHLTADQILERVQQIHPRISKATVYRNLNQMAEEGTLLRLKFSSGPDYYDYRTEEHGHGICTVCGGVFDLEVSPEEDWAGRIRESHGFRVTGAQLVFEGVCSACAAAAGSLPEQESEKL